MRAIFICLFLFANFLSLYATTWTISPTGTYKSPTDVRSLAQNGDTILIDAATYTDHPQVIFPQNNLVIKGINGQPRLEAGNTLASKSNGKAIFVLSGENCRVENIEFANARVPDRNGAGIRQEGCNLLVTNCSFIGNEMGILGGNYSPCKVVIEHCVFKNNGSSANPGFQHNIYINHIDTLIFRYNRTTDAIAEGHELKSRAHFNLIAYNYIGNIESNDSRNIDLPNGGTSIVIGNVIEQGSTSVNSNLLGYGLEGLTNNQPHNLYAVSNTFVNKKDKGSFIQVANSTDTLVVKNNVLAGAKTGGLILGSAKYLDSSTNYINGDVTATSFVDQAKFDYHLFSSSPCVDSGNPVSKSIGVYVLTPQFEYKDVATFNTRVVSGQLDIGAYEYARPLSVDIAKRPNLRLYPSPFIGTYLYVNFSTAKHYQLYNEVGEKVAEGLFQGGKTYIPQLPSGLYFLRTDNGSSRLLRP